jgi:hypothetical protein
VEPDETERWMPHLAGCRRCQATLGALARAEKEARPDRPLLPNSWTQIRRLLHWPVLAPLAAGAVVVLAVWVISPGTTRDRGQAPATSRADVAAEPAALATGEVTGELASESSAQPLAETRLGLPRGDESGGLAERPPERQPARQTPAVAIPAVRLDPADARAEESRAAIAPPTRVERLSSVETVALATNDTPPLVAQETLTPTGTVILPSPQDTLQWRAGSGTIARTDNGGLSWRVQLAVPEQVVAGAAPSASVAWLVGEGGLVLRTVDGEQWTRLPPPAIVSLIAVDATDGFRATVTTEDERRFRTEDAGTTWTLLR